MTDHSGLASELCRLVTEGHQDSSLESVLAKKFPNITQSEFEAAHTKLAARRRRKMKARLGADDD